MAERIVSKNLAGLEDLLLGTGSVVQERSGQPYPISKIPLIYIANSVPDLVNADTSKFTYAIIFEDGYKVYHYDTTWQELGSDVAKKLLELTGAELVKTSTGKSVQEAIYSSGVVRGNDGYNYAISGAAFRRYTGTSLNWQMVEDATHIPVNTFSVTSGVDVSIEYKGSKIGSLVCGPDESLAKDGVLVGGSVGPDNAIISLGAPCSFVCDLTTPTNPIQKDDKFFDASRFSLSVAASGQITIAHPQRRLMQYPIVQHFSDNSLFEQLEVHYVSAPSPGGFTCYLLGEAEGQITYDGTNWIIGSSAWSSSELTFSYDAPTGVLTVTHPVLLGSPGLAVTPQDNGATLFTSPSQVSNTSFKVKFRRFDDTVPTLSTALGFYFTRGVSAIRKVPQGKLHVYLGHVQVNCNHVDYQFGNFWTLGIMRDDS